MHKDTSFVDPQLPKSGLELAATKSLVTLPIQHKQAIYNPTNEQEFTHGTGCEISRTLTPHERHKSKESKANSGSKDRRRKPEKPNSSQIEDNSLEKVAEEHRPGAIDDKFLVTLHTLTIHERVKAPSPTVNPKPHNCLLVEETLELPGQLRRIAEPP
ncbi:hypothetical protein F2Q69_00011702 [Brassica cretica]|uniref:Uncharacterized protein n=1 Tax=Brassica cretica TaxID=69181 RepID=A0A8S9QKS0_BRACR|nr:hypothetical protein F2Q69_00011702 [Brassica cretica]